jgi:hypothetical protein
MKQKHGDSELARKLETLLRQDKKPRRLQQKANKSIGKRNSQQFLSTLVRGHKKLSRVRRVVLDGRG